jgi:hypothetical protein
MALTDVARKDRQERIITATAEIPYTMQELVPIIGTTYHTIRNDVLDLQNQGKIRMVGTRNKSYTWSSSAYALMGWPTVFSNSQATDGLSLKQAAIRSRSEFYNRMIRTVFVADRSFMKILLFANDLRTGHGFEKSAVVEARAELSVAIKELRKFITELESLNSIERLWTKDGLAELLEIEDFPKKETLRQIEEVELPLATDNFIQYLNANKEAILNAAQRDATEVQSGTASDGSGAG